MDVRDRVRLRQRQQVVVAVDRMRPVGEALAAELLLAETERLNARPGRAVEDHDALVEQPLQPVDASFDP